MNWHEPQNDPLDELLQKAHWPDPQPEHLNRLQHGWQRTVRRRKITRLASAAAVILIPIIGVVGALTISHHCRPIEQQIVERPMKAAPMKAAPMVAENQSETKQPISNVAVAPHDRPESRVQIVREPNAYERALALLHRQKIAAVKVAAKHSSMASVAVDPIAAAIQRLIDQPALDVAVIAQEIAANVGDSEARLCRWLQTSAGSADPVETVDQLAAKRQTALRLLATLATPESAPLLSAAMQNENCPVEVFEAIARLSTTEQLVARARFEPSAERRQFWLAALLERGSPQVVGEFLNLVNHPQMSASALSSVSSATNLPLEELFSAMLSPRVRVREAAARVLGTLSDPAVSKRLIEMAMSTATRREALIALMTSSDPVARQFVIYAQRDLTLAASVHALSNRFASIQSVN